MNVTLIFPGIALPGFNSFLKIHSIDANYIDHGLASISAALKASGHSVNLIDLRTLNDWQHFRQLIRDGKSSVYGISSWSLHYPDARICASIIKMESPQSITVLGGVHATISTDEVLKDENFDYVIGGEGEISFVDLLNNIQNSGKPNDRLINGITPDLNQIPWVDRDLFDMAGEFYTPIVPSLPTPFSTLNAGRGCPFTCKFCQPAERMVFGNQVRIREPQNVIDELLYLKNRFSIASWMAHDDLFFIDRKWIKKFCDLYRKNKINLPFVCQMRSDLICKFEEDFRYLAETGLVFSLIGFESGSQRILDMYKKKTTVQENINAAEICKKYGVKIWGNFMFGNPTETREDVLDTIRLIWKINPDYFSPSFFTPTPGSFMYEQAKQEDWFLVDDYAASCRSITHRKIKGVDYSWLRKAVALGYQTGTEDLLKRLSAQNSDWNDDIYLDCNFDVLLAVKNGFFVDGYHHFISFGYRENRRGVPKKYMDF